ncbi:hypothetical protein Y032_0171g307 [Ancylostoma ceylanicum]|uniref:Uncharacterized protein n=1 Tax=Ancylostoma ceylanicum TaxID=53326 RepID=A0A016SVP9_9BILA|nr:hypothetical protein Y032_0171g307 [Ancylostoma ceylanicum]
MSHLHKKGLPSWKQVYLLRRVPGLEVFSCILVYGLRVHEDGMSGSRKSSTSVVVGKSSSVDPAVVIEWSFDGE